MTFVPAAGACLMTEPGYGVRVGHHLHRRRQLHAGLDRDRLGREHVLGLREVRDHGLLGHQQDHRGRDRRRQWNGDRQPPGEPRALPVGGRHRWRRLRRSDRRSRDPDRAILGPPEPDLLGRENRERSFDSPAGIDRDRRLREPELALALGVDRLQQHFRGGIRAVAQRQHEPRLQPSGGAVRRDLADHVLVGLDVHGRRRRGDLGLVRPRESGYLISPRPRLRVRRARRVDVDLDLLLVIAARPVRHQVRSRGRDRPPPRRQPPHRDVVVVDDPALVADQREQDQPLSRLDARGHRTGRLLLRLRQPQQQRRRSRRRGARAAARTHDRRPRSHVGCAHGRRSRYGRRAGRQRQLGVRRRSYALACILVNMFVGRSRGRPRRRRPKRVKVLGRLPTQVLTAFTEIAVIPILAAATWTDSHVAPWRR